MQQTVKIIITVNCKKSHMWKAALRGKSVGKEILRNLKTTVFTGKIDNSQSDIRDEARYGCGFEGILKRYFK